MTNDTAYVTGPNKQPLAKKDHHLRGKRLQVRKEDPKKEDNLEVQDNLESPANQDSPGDRASLEVKGHPEVKDSPEDRVDQESPVNLESLLLPLMSPRQSSRPRQSLRDSRAPVRDSSGTRATVTASTDASTSQAKARDSWSMSSTAPLDSSSMRGLAYVIGPTTRLLATAVKTRLPPEALLPPNKGRLLVNHPLMVTLLVPHLQKARLQVPRPQAATHPSTRQRKKRHLVTLPVEVALPVILRQKANSRARNQIPKNRLINRPATASRGAAGRATSATQATATSSTVV